MNYDPSVIAPFSQDAEEAVLGSVFINPDAFLYLNTFLKPEDFYILRHAYIWEAMQRVAARPESVIDLLTVREELRRSNRLNDVGGPSYLTQLTVNVPTSVHAEVYGRLVEQASKRRKLLTAADEIRALAMDETRHWDDVAEAADRRVTHVTGDTAVKNLEPIRISVNDVLDDIEERMTNPDAPSGLPTGYRDLDLLLNGGLRRGELAIAAGRPGMGKSSMATCVAVNVGRLGAKAFLSNLEMTNAAVTARMLAMESGVSTSRMKGVITPDEWRKIARAAHVIGNMNLWMDDTPSQRLTMLKSEIERVQQRHGLDLVVIDYLGLLQPTKRKDGNRVLEVSEITYFLKHEIAKALHVPVLALAQLSRKLEERKDKRPMLSDLRDSGSTEQDADVVMFLYRDAVYNEATEFPSLCELIVAKQRDGATGTVNLHFEKALTKFSDARTMTIDLSSL